MRTLPARFASSLLGTSAGCWMLEKAGCRMKQSDDLAASGYPGSSHLASASRWIEPRGFTANPRRIASTEAEVLYVPLVIRLGGRIERPVQLIVRTAKIPLIVGSAIVTMISRRDYARILSGSRTGDGGGNNSNSADCFEFGHGSGFSVTW